MSYTLFVGDLAIGCTEDNLRQTFSKFGEIVEIRIAKNLSSGQNLRYGFVKFLRTECAEQALEMDGKILNGRRMRLSKATTSKSNMNKMTLHGNNSAETIVRASIHVEFIVVCENHVSTSEDVLRDMFSLFGEVVDVKIIRRSAWTNDAHQSGYGFVHYANNAEGSFSATKAVDALGAVTINGVSFVCSHRRVDSRSPRQYQCQQRAEERAYAQNVVSPLQNQRAPVFPGSVASVTSTASSPRSCEGLVQQQQQQQQQNYSYPLYPTTQAVHYAPAYAYPFAPENQFQTDFMMWQQQQQSMQQRVQQVPQVQQHNPHQYYQCMQQAQLYQQQYRQQQPNQEYQCQQQVVPSHFMMSQQQYSAPFQQQQQQQQPGPQMGPHCGYFI